MNGTPKAANHVPRAVWVACGAVSLGLGMIGVLLPLIPTTPFLIVAAWAFGKGSPALRRRLMDHPRVGGALRDWEAHGAIATRYKVFACISMAVVLGLGLLVKLPPSILGLQALVLVGAMLFILTRPSPGGQGE
ncbi:YbaN family protein [uncultured Jannaschia sp.]|uniref:YbaN family protein n=1 Tax=uncultured Jannaschia sp. TaxID=293347 RepID=UPI00262E5EAC|nr:YbaN family protein [uncultured Jannaschia sp.]